MGWYHGVVRHAERIFCPWSALPGLMGQGGERIIKNRGLGGWRGKQHPRLTTSTVQWFVLCNNWGLNLCPPGGQAGTAKKKGPQIHKTALQPYTCEYYSSAMVVIVTQWRDGAGRPKTEMNLLKRTTKTVHRGCMSLGFGRGGQHPMLTTSTRGTYVRSSSRWLPCTAPYKKNVGLLNNS